jgi:imidazolonepropionase-like amidohydrolase
MRPRPRLKRLSHLLHPPQEVAPENEAAVQALCDSGSSPSLIDLSDKTVLPGLIDCHTHLVDALMAVNGDPFNVVKKTAAQMVLAAVPNAEKTLLSGLTSVQDVPSR